MTYKSTTLTAGTVEVWSENFTISQNRNLLLLQKLLLGEDIQLPFIVQIIGSRKVQNSSSDDSKARYRLVISDGQLIHSFAMVALELNYMHEANQFTDNTIISVGRFTSSVVNSDK